MCKLGLPLLARLSFPISCHPAVYTDSATHTHTAIHQLHARTTLVVLPSTVSAHLGLHSPLLILTIFTRRPARHIVSGIPWLNVPFSALMMKLFCLPHSRHSQLALSSSSFLLPPVCSLWATPYILVAQHPV